jgi:predicted nucleic-acid-binding Zn-ribbon protein
MTAKCPKCGGEMEEGRIANKFLFGFKSARQKHWSFEANVEKARACLDCGYIEMYVDPQEVKKKLADAAASGA